MCIICTSCQQLGYDYLIVLLLTSIHVHIAISALVWPCISPVLPYGVRFDLSAIYTFQHFGCTWQFLYIPIFIDITSKVIEIVNLFDFIVV